MDGRMLKDAKNLTSYLRSIIVVDGEMKSIGYVAILTRAIPVEDYKVDTSAHFIQDCETVRDVMDWAERLCSGSAVMIRVEIVKAS